MILSYLTIIFRLMLEKERLMVEIKPNIDNSRQRLADIIPLAAPFTVYIEQTRVCNLKCFYCVHSTRDEEDGEFQKLGYKIKHMSLDDYLKVINDLKEFPKGSIKRIVFSGLGEPTANPKLPEFVKIAVESEIAERVEIITNGLLLNKKLIDKLIDAKITNINISIQGLSVNKYKKICGADIDFDKFLKTLEYLYDNKKNTKIYIKIIDAALENEKEKEEFYRIFSPFADRIYVEHLVQMQQSLEKIKNIVDCTKNFYGEKVDMDRKVCSPVFYFLQIGCDLDVFPCPVPGLSRGLSMGNLKINNIKEIWNGKKRNAILKTMLKFQKDKLKDCNGCYNFNCISHPLEYLDKHSENLLKRLENGNN